MTKKFTITGKICINEEKLNVLVYEALKHADSGIYKKGDNYWEVMFNDKLKELLENNEYYTIEYIDKECK